MGLPYSGPSVTVNFCCDEAHLGAPDLAPYVKSIFSLQGIISLGNTGAIQWRSEGNTIYADLSAAAGLGSVTSVGLSSTSLTVGSSPVTTSGTITVNLTGATASIQGLVTAADKMIYTTASNVYAVTDLTAFARTLLDDANSTAARSTLGLVIGTNVQAWSADLDSYITHGTWTGNDLALAGDLAVAGNLDVIFTLTAGGGSITSLDCENLLVTDSATVTNSVTANSFSGDGAALTNLDGGAIQSGTVVASRGGTGLSSYTVGDLIYASGGTLLAKLASVSAGSFLRSAGVGTASAWSAVKWPDTIVVGDILYASTTTAMSRLADVATGNALISGGVGVAPVWGKVTASHTTGLAASGANNDITSFGQAVTFNDFVTVQSDFTILGGLYDSTSSAGSPGYILTSTGGLTEWSDQITVSTLTINTGFSIEGTITGAGVTGNQTINKPSGTCRLAAGASSLIVTNSLCSTSSRVLATVTTNDATTKSVQTVSTNGAFTIFANAAATSECEISWMLFNIS